MDFHSSSIRLLSKGSNRLLFRGLHPITGEMRNSTAQRNAFSGLAKSEKQRHCLSAHFPGSLRNPACAYART